MSARQRRRFQAQAARDGGLHAAHGDGGGGGAGDGDGTATSGSEEEVTPPTFTTAATTARFSLLSADDSVSDSGASAGDGDEVDTEAGAGEGAPLPIPTTTTSASNGRHLSTARVRSARVGKAGGKRAGAAPAGGDSTTSATTAGAGVAEGGDDDFDAALAAAGTGNAAAVAASASGNMSAEATLNPWAVAGPRACNVDIELTRFLGRGHRPAGTGDHAGGMPLDRAFTMGRGGGGGGGRHHGWGLFVTTGAGDEWAHAAIPGRTGGGISMARTTTPLGPVYHWEASDEYATVNWDLDAAMMYAPAGPIPALMAVLQRCPFHVETLLALHEAHRTMGQAEAAAMYLRRAMVVVQQSLHPTWRPWSTPCRLKDPDHRDNAGMIRAAWRFALHAGRAGAPGAAWNIVNLCLQLCGFDGSVDAPVPAPIADPHRMLLLWDAFALRCAAHDAILAATGVAPKANMTPVPTTTRARHCWPATDVPMVYLPGMAFARALALWRTRGGRTGAATVAPSSLTTAPPLTTLVLPGTLSHLYRDATVWGDDDPNRTLMRAILTFPHALLPLLTAAGWEGGGSAAARAWNTACPPSPTGAAYAKLIDICVMRQGGQWREAATQTWLASMLPVATTIMQSAAAWRGGGHAAANAIAAASPSWVWDGFGGVEGVVSEAMTADLVRQQLFQGGHVADAALARAQTCLAHYAGAVPSDFNDTVAVIDPAMLAVGGGEGGGAMVPTPPGMRHLNLRETNLVWLLWQTLLPWYLVPGAPLVQDAH